MTRATTRILQDRETPALAALEPSLVKPLRPAVLLPDRYPFVAIPRPDRPGGNSGARRMAMWAKEGLRKYDIDIKWQANPLPVAHSKPSADEPMVSSVQPPTPQNDRTVPYVANGKNTAEPADTGILALVENEQ